ncbi:hypothetical protein EGT74_23665 [Chitinophaga lutea]|uniref:Uncharacterized protein n=1 Tax=Chitinophaga lutea TaxID=2488634 RepID=A0A3N4PD87_9BACT|nr:hypothetical protein EGT74_23665 [Chitinophaga lutea]
MVNNLPLQKFTIKADTVLPALAMKACLPGVYTPYRSGVVMPGTTKVNNLRLQKCTIRAGIVLPTMETYPLACAHTI